MLEEKAKIFLADERGLNQLDWFRSYNTFNLPAGQAGFGKYCSEHKEPFGDLYVLNDDTLAAGKNLEMSVEKPTDIVLIPIVGAVEFNADNIGSKIVEAGQVLQYPANKNSAIGFTNPYENGLINFLQIWVKRDMEIDDPAVAIFSFDINENKNALVDLFPRTSNYKIGKYKGREEGSYKLSNADGGLFVFIIEGAFEVQGRLLHQRDGLALWNRVETDFEALSNDAIILLLEVQKKPEA